MAKMRVTRDEQLRLEMDRHLPPDKRRLLAELTAACAERPPGEDAFAFIAGWLIEHGEEEAVLHLARQRAFEARREYRQRRRRPQ